MMYICAAIIWHAGCVSRVQSDVDCNARLAVVILALAIIADVVKLITQG